MLMSARLGKVLAVCSDSRTDTAELVVVVVVVIVVVVVASKADYNVDRVLFLFDALLVLFTPGFKSDDCCTCLIIRAICRARISNDGGGGGGDDGSGAGDVLFFFSFFFLCNLLHCSHNYGFVVCLFIYPFLGGGGCWGGGGRSRYVLLLFIYSFVPSFVVHALIYLFIHSFVVYLYIVYLFIHLFICSFVSFFLYIFFSFFIDIFIYVFTFFFISYSFEGGQQQRFRKLLGISYRDHISNGDVKVRIGKAIGPYEDLLTSVKRRKLKWYRHVT